MAWHVVGRIVYGSSAVIDYNYILNARAIWFCRFRDFIRCNRTYATEEKCNIFIHLLGLANMFEICLFEMFYFIHNVFVYGRAIFTSSSGSSNSYERQTPPFIQKIWPVTYVKISHIWCWYVNIAKHEKDGRRDCNRDEMNKFLRHSVSKCGETFFEF